MKIELLNKEIEEFVAMRESEGQKLRYTFIIIGPKYLPVPDHFFNALLIKDATGYHAIAFLCPNIAEVESRASSLVFLVASPSFAPPSHKTPHGRWRFCPMKLKNLSKARYTY